MLLSLFVILFAATRFATTRSIATALLSFFAAAVTAVGNDAAGEITKGSAFI